jgi:hypothetical protein
MQRFTRIGLVCLSFLSILSTVPVSAIGELTGNNNINIITEEDGELGLELVEDLDNPDDTIDENVAGVGQDEVTPRDVITTSEVLSEPTDDLPLPGVLAPLDLKISKVQIGSVSSVREEFVELYNSSPNTVDLNGVQVVFTTTGMTTGGRLLANITGETLLEGFGTYVLAFRGYFEDIKDQEFTVNTTNGGSIGRNGTLALRYNGAAIDTVGWGVTIGGGFEGRRILAFVEGQVIARCVDQNTLIMRDTEDNVTDFEFFDTELLPAQTVYCAVLENPNLCGAGLRLNEIGANINDQFIEIKNNSEEYVSLFGCGVRTNRNSFVYWFEELELAPGEILEVSVQGSGLTLTKTTTGTVEMLNELGEVADSTTYSNMTADTSWALFDGGWRQTFAITPGEENVWEEFRPCAVGWFRAETGFCRRIATVAPATLADCGPGRYRSPETNRCRNIATARTSALTLCRPGQYRNPETNRCRRIPVATALAPCRPGQYRNPETNRCRNIRVNQGTGYGVEPSESHDASSFVGWVAFGGLALAGLAYVGFEFRREIARAGRKLLWAAGRK